MDAVLPLTLRDVERFDLLWTTLQRFVTGLDALWIPVPASSERELQKVVQQRCGSSSGVRVVSELDLLPTLRTFPKTKGWYRQMLLKLEAAQHVDSTFYLTLDADVIATRKVDLDALCSDGRAPCHVDHADIHPKWYRAAQDILGSPLRRANVSHGVTPALLHAPSVRSLLEFLDDRWEQGSYGAGLRGLKQRFGKANAAFARLTNPNVDVRGWCAYLCHSRPWAEYALYFSYLELTGQFDRYFVEVNEALYSVHGSVWQAEAFASWDPSNLFLGEGAPYFAVVQSNASLAIEEVKARLQPHLHGPNHNA